MIKRTISQPSDLRRRDMKWARACAIAILAFSLAYALMLPSGGTSGMTYDSFRYLAGADSILASGTYLDPSGAPQSTWPPGTSILYAVGAKLTGRPPEELIQFLNLAALLLMAVSLWLIIEMTIARWWIAVITFAAIFLNTAILSLLNKLSSDPLALAVTSAAMASGVAAGRGGKNWFGWICVASGLLCIALCLRPAMLPAIPILAAVAFSVSKMTDSHPEAALLPLLSPLLTLISFYFLGSTQPPISYVHQSGTPIFSFAFRDHSPAFIQMADQVFPTALVGTWFSIVLVTICLIAVPAATAFAASMPEKRGALLICVGYVVLSSLFLVMVRVMQHLPVEFRYLLQIYPFVLIGAAIAADFLLNWQRLNSRVLGFIIVALLSASAARSSRATSLGLLDHESQQSASCRSRIALLNDLKRIPVTIESSGVLTNIQGLAWYALRVPTRNLTWSTLADAPSGTVIIFVRPTYTCPYIVDSEDISEIALTRVPGISIVSNSGAVMIARKE
jgi:hypothetical protein